MSYDEAISRLLALASEEFSDAAASIQHGAEVETMAEVPEWAALVAYLASGMYFSKPDVASKGGEG